MEISGRSNCFSGSEAWCRGMCVAVDEIVTRASRSSGMVTPLSSNTPKRQICTHLACENSVCLPESAIAKDPDNQVEWRSLHADERGTTSVKLLHTRMTWEITLSGLETKNVIVPHVKV